MHSADPGSALFEAAFGQGCRGYILWPMELSCDTAKARFWQLGENKQRDQICQPKAMLV